MIIDNRRKALRHKKYMLLVFIWTLTVLSAPSISQSAVTVFKDYLFENPPAVVLSRLVPQKGCQTDSATGELRILVFGDNGTGDENQLKVAGAMQKFCEKNGCDLALMLGDNIHPQGVRSADDPQFVEKFEKPYEGLCIPFYAILGEHDWGRKDERYNWKAQVEYSQRSSRYLQVKENVILVKVVSAEGEIMYSSSLPKQKRSDPKGVKAP